MNQVNKEGFEYMATTTIRKWGNSLALRIPQDIAEKVNFNDGAEVEMHVNDKEREILLRPVFPEADDNESLRKHFLELRKKCKPGMSAHKEMFDESEGDEII